MRWVLIPIHKPMGYAENGRAICSCELGNGKKWDNCNPEKPGKHPWCKWKDIETPEQGYAAFRNAYDKRPDGVNIGIRTGRASNMWAVDLDVGSMKFGVTDFETWMEKSGLTWKDCDTLTAVTGGGGRHIVFTYPNAVEKIPTVAPHPDLGRAVDVKGDGGYILVHPSLHISGRIYEWQTAIGPEALKLAPEKLIATVQGRKRKTLDTDPHTNAYTPSLAELKDYADELSRKRSQHQKIIGENMMLALIDKPIALEGGAHDAYRDIMFFIVKRWPRPDAKEIVSHFETSVAARFEDKPGASTDIANLLDSLYTAIEKANEEASSWAGQVAVNDAGRPTAGDANYLLYFRNHPAWQGVLGYNLRRNRPVYLKRPPLDRDTPLGDIDFSRDKTLISLWFQTKAKMVGRISKEDLLSALIGASWDHKFDPLVDLVSQLHDRWDGVPRLETAMQRVAGTPDTAWARLVFPLWMKSLVARLLRPGCKVDTMLILEGPQGFKKSTFFSSLLPDHCYFSDSLTKVHHDVESIRLVHSGPAIFEVGELSALGKQEVEAIKAFLSAFQDDLRPLYEQPRSTPRRCILVGTTNRDSYLRDETGGRRFWPLKVLQKIEIDTVITEREQWFAEALHRIKIGEPWWLEDDQANLLAHTEQEERYEEDIWEQPVVQWLADEAKPPSNPTTATEQMAAELNKHKANAHVTTIQVALYALKVELKNARTAEGIRINKILRRLGWTPERFDGGSGRWVRGWKRP
jgi:predicted P-loop ATPase